MIEKHGNSFSRKDAEPNGEPAIESNRATDCSGKNENVEDINIPTKESIIAPCGMNCGVCRAYLRAKNKCSGCRGSDADKPNTRTTCKIKTCDFYKTSEARYCFACPDFPCKSLSRMDERYRIQYAASVIENLEAIRDRGEEHFLDSERSKWRCTFCGGTICIHNRLCSSCRK